MKRLVTALLTAAIVAIVAGCGSSGGSAPARTPSSSTSVATVPNTYPGETAATIAGLIPGCTDVQPYADTDGTQGSPTSAASCLLAGRKVWISSYSSPAGADARGLLEDNKAETYWLRNDAGWIATSGDDPRLELQLANQAGALLRYSLSGQTPPPPDIPGQLSSMQQVKKALGGTIYHVLADGSTDPHVG